MAKPYTTHHHIPNVYRPSGSFPEGEQILPEDFEQSDAEKIKKLIDDYFDYAYPTFEPEVITSPTKDKEYFLPALKILKRTDGRYFSPQYEVEWKDMELQAECRVVTLTAPNVIKYIKDSYGNIDMIADDVVPTFEHRHPAPDKNCDCGIYGSVNLDEILNYVNPKTLDYYAQMTGRWGYDEEEYQVKTVVCVIEPSPDADVIVCRKGWRASHAFISEIVGETISVNDASSLLSIAWHRNIDIRRIYEGR